MSKKWMVSLVIGTVLLSFFGGQVYGSIYGTFLGYPVVRIVVNGEEIRGDVPGVVLNGRTMVPVRFVAEALGAKVDWHSDTSTVEITSEDSSINTSPIATYGVTLESLGSASGDGSYAPGTSITVSTTIPDGHTFNCWVNGDMLVSTSPTFQFVVPAVNTVLRAEFTQVKDDDSRNFFAENFAVTIQRYTTSNEIVATARYTGTLNVEDFFEMWSKYDNKKSDAEEFVRVLQLDKPNYAFAVTFYYSAYNLGYAFAYPQGYQLSSFVINPRGVH